MKCFHCVGKTILQSLHTAHPSGGALGQGLPQRAESKRLKEDSYAKLKYDSTQTQDLEIIKRVNELAEKYDVSMTEISLAWILTKVTSPVVGATKYSHVDGAVNAVELNLHSG